MPSYNFMDDNIKIIANNIVDIKVLFIPFNLIENALSRPTLP